MANCNDIEDEEVSKDTLQFLQTKIAKNWKILGRYLGVNDPKLDNIQADNLLSQQEQVYQMLLTWTQSEGRDATYKRLFRALEDFGQGGLVDEVKRRREMEKSKKSSMSY